jgi:hypothetical protein
LQISLVQGVDVARQLVAVAIVHDHVIGNGESLGTRGLCGENLSGGTRIDPIALHDALDLQLLGGIHHEYSIEISATTALDEQRNHMDLIRAGRSLRPSLHPGADRRMRDGLEVAPRRWVREDLFA